MDFIQSSNKQVDKFGPGKHGFSAGNPTAGILATYFTNIWADGVQQELLNVIEAAGLTPTSADLAQLLVALRSENVFQTAANTDNSTKVATTQWVRNVFASLLATSGYQKFPGGLILQWGTVSGLAGGGTSTVVTLPVAPPNSILHVLVVPFGSNASTNTQAISKSGAYTSTGFTIFLDGPAGGSYNLRWLAITY